MDKILWKDEVYQSLVALGGKASLKNIYHMVQL